MANTILVIAEQRENKLVRVSLETIAAAQQIAKALVEKLRNEVRAF